MARENQLAHCNLDIFEWGLLVVIFSPKGILGIFAMVHEYHGCWSTQGISSVAHSLSLWKKISHPSLVIYFSATPPIKLKLGQEKVGGGTTNSKPFGLINHYDGPFKSTDRQSDRIYDTLFSRCTPLPFFQPPQTVELCWAKSILPERNRHMLTVDLILLCTIRCWAQLEMVLNTPPRKRTSPLKLQRLYKRRR